MPGKRKAMSELLFTWDLVRVSKKTKNLNTIIDGDGKIAANASIAVKEDPTKKVFTTSHAGDVVAGQISLIDPNTNDAQLWIRRSVSNRAKFGTITEHVENLTPETNAYVARTVLIRASFKKNTEVVCALQTLGQTLRFNNGHDMATFLKEDYDVSDTDKTLQEIADEHNGKPIPNKRPHTPVRALAQPPVKNGIKSKLSTIELVGILCVVFLSVWTILDTEVSHSSAIINEVMHKDPCEKKFTTKCVKVVLSGMTLTLEVYSTVDKKIVTTYDSIQRRENETFRFHNSDKDLRILPENCNPETRENIQILIGGNMLDRIHKCHGDILTSGYVKGKCNADTCRCALIAIPPVIHTVEAANLASQFESCWMVKVLLFGFVTTWGEEAGNQKLDVALKTLGWIKVSELAKPWVNQFLNRKDNYKEEWTSNVLEHAFYYENWKPAALIAMASLAITLCAIYTETYASIFQSLPHQQDSFTQYYANNFVIRTKRSTDGHDNTKETTRSSDKILMFSWLVLLTYMCFNYSDILSKTLVVNFWLEQFMPPCVLFMAFCVYFSVLYVGKVTNAGFANLLWYQSLSPLASGFFDSLGQLCPDIYRSIFILRFWQSYATVNCCFLVLVDILIVEGIVGWGGCDVMWGCGVVILFLIVMVVAIDIYFKDMKRYELGIALFPVLAGVFFMVCTHQHGGLTVTLRCMLIRYGMRGFFWNLGIFDQFFFFVIGYCTADTRH